MKVQVLSFGLLVVGPAIGLVINPGNRGRPRANTCGCGCGGGCQKGGNSGYGDRALNYNEGYDNRLLGNPYDAYVNNGEVLFDNSYDNGLNNSYGNVGNGYDQRVVGEEVIEIVDEIIEREVPNPTPYPYNPNPYPYLPSPFPYFPNNNGAIDVRPPGYGQEVILDERVIGRNGQVVEEVIIDEQISPNGNVRINEEVITPNGNNEVVVTEEIINRNNGDQEIILDERLIGRNGQVVEEVIIDERILPNGDVRINEEIINGNQIIPIRAIYPLDPPPQPTLLIENVVTDEIIRTPYGTEEIIITDQVLADLARTAPLFNSQYLLLPDNARQNVTPTNYPIDWLAIAETRRVTPQMIFANAPSRVQYNVYSDQPANVFPGRNVTYEDCVCRSIPIRAIYDNGTPINNSIIARNPNANYVQQFLDGSVFEGEARWYDNYATNLGSCGLNTSDPRFGTFFIGLPRIFMPEECNESICSTYLSPLCGLCAVVTNSAGESIVARIVDTANTNTYNIILSEPAFAQLGNIRDGVIVVTYQLSECPVF